MNSYFLPRLYGDQKRKLDEASVSYYDFVLQDEQGIIVQEDCLQQALDLLELKLKAQTATQYEGIFRVSIQTPASPDAELTTSTSAQGTWQGKNQDGVTRIVAAVLMPFLQQDIVVDNPRAVTNPVEDDKFHVHIFAAPAKSEHRKTPSTIWGIPTDCAGDGAWGPSGKGKSFADGNCVVAELIGSHLYILHNLVKTGSKAEEMVLSVLLERVLEQMLGEQSKAQAERLFVDICSQLLLEKSNEEKSIEEVQAAARELKKELKRTVRLALVEELKLLRNESISTDDIFSAEYEALLKVPKVKNVQVENGVIIVSTELLFARDPRNGNYHEIGEFKIHLSPSASSPLWFNQTRQVVSCSADQGRPLQGVHIWNSGKACLGNADAIFTSLFKQREWALAAQVAIEFAESVNQVNNDAAGMGVHHWPRASAATIAARDQRIATKAEPTEAQLAYRAQYVRACADRVKALEESSLEQIAQMRQELERIQCELISVLRTRLVKQRQQARKRICDRSDLAREFTALAKTARVRAITLRPGTVSVWTESLFSQCPETKLKHEIGKFRIDIHLDGRSDCLRFYNLSQVIDGCKQLQQAPRVLNSGRACLNELRETFPDLIAELKLSVLVQLAIEFIEQMDADDHNAAFIKLWPEAS